MSSWGIVSSMGGVDSAEMQQQQPMTSSVDVQQTTNGEQQQPRRNDRQPTKAIQVDLMGLDSSIQKRCVCHWFVKWDGQQRQSFVRHLTHTWNLQPPALSSLSPSQASLNNVVLDNEMSKMIGDMSLDTTCSVFQCQLRLFESWSSEWSWFDKRQLIEEIQRIDPQQDIPRRWLTSYPLLGNTPPL